MFMILLCCTMSGCYIMSMKGFLLCLVSLQTLPSACEEGQVGQEFRLDSKDSAFSIILWALNSIIALGIFFYPRFLPLLFRISAVGEYPMLICLGDSIFMADISKKTIIVVYI